jgi:hypothetical protein
MISETWILDFQEGSHSRPMTPLIRFINFSVSLCPAPHFPGADPTLYIRQGTESFQQGGVAEQNKFEVGLRSYPNEVQALARMGNSDTRPVMKKLSAHTEALKLAPLAALYNNLGTTTWPMNAGSAPHPFFASSRSTPTIPTPTFS